MAVICENDERLVFMPLESTLSANGMCNVVRDHWWCVHPKKGLVFWQDGKRRKGKLIGASVQANKNKSVTQHFGEKMYPWAEITLIPIVLVPVDLKDYL